MSIDIEQQGPSTLQRNLDANARQTELPPALSTGSIGAVFVHGMGEQGRAEILLEWSSAIVRGVGDWTRSVTPTPDPWNGDRIVRSEINFEGSDLPIVTLRVPAATVGDHDYKAMTWVMTEARWAQHVRPPSLQTMIDWCGPSGVVAEVIGRIVDRRMTGKWASLRPLAKMGLATFVSVMVSISLTIYAVLRAIAGVIPWKPLQDAIARVQLDNFLTASWGDVHLLLNDPVQAANIRGQVSTTIQALRSYGCERVVIVAHSGGTIASYMALADPAFRAAVPSAAADALITHGQAIDMARRIHAREGSPATRPGAQLAPETPLPNLGAMGWHDYYGTHDPAPAGPPGGPASDGTEVWNRLSIAGDHGTYWTNDEEFVNDVLVKFEDAGATVPGAPTTPSRFAFDPAGTDWVLRRRQRVFVLSLWKRLMFVIPLFAIMAAFFQANSGLMPNLRDTAFDVASIVPGASSIWEQLQKIPEVPFHGFLVSSASYLIALFAISALIQALLPIANWKLWTGWRRRFFAFLDVGVAIVAIVVVPIVQGAQEGALSIWNRIFDPPIGLALLTAVAIFLVVLVVQANPTRDTVGGTGLRASLTRALRAVVLPVLAVVGWVVALAGRLPTIVGRVAVVAVGLGIVLLLAYGVIEDYRTRMMVVGAAVAFALFQIVARVGAWRWSKWDELERAVARRRGTPPRRLGVWLQFGLLAIPAAILGIAIATGEGHLVGRAGLILGVLIAALLITDVVAEEA